MKVNFDEKTHTYTDEQGNVVPSVTTILKDLGVGGDYANIPDIEWYADRGTLTHYGIELILSGIPTDMYQDLMLEKSAELADGKKKPVTVEDVSGYIGSFMQVRDLFEPEEDGLERRFISEDGRFAGTIDFCGTIKGRKGKADWKTSQKPNRAYHLQLGGAYRDPDDEVCYLVHLKKDGSMPDIIETDADAPDVWGQLLDIYFSDMTDDDKRFAAKTVALGSVTLEKEDADQIAALRREMKRMDSEKKRIEAVTKDIEQRIQKSLGGRPGVYRCDEYEISMSPVAGRKSVDTDGFIKYLIDNGHGHLVDALNERFTSRGVDYYKVDVKEKRKKKEAVVNVPTGEASPVGPKASGKTPSAQARRERPIEKNLFDLIEKTGHNLVDFLHEMRDRYEKEVGDMTDAEIRVEINRLSAPASPVSAVSVADKHAAIERNPWIVQQIENGATVGISRDEILSVAAKFGEFSDGRWMLTYDTEGEMRAAVAAIKPPDTAPKRRGRKKKSDSLSPVGGGVDMGDSGAEPPPLEDNAPENAEELTDGVRKAFLGRGHSEDDLNRLFSVLEMQCGKSIQLFDETEFAFALAFAKEVRSEEVHKWKDML